MSAMSGQLVGVEELMVEAAGQARSIGQRLVAAPQPETSVLSVPFVPEVGQFLSSLQSARARHRSAVNSLGLFFQDATAALEDFQAQLAAADGAAGSGFRGIESGSLR